MTLPAPRIRRAAWQNGHMFRASHSPTNDRGSASTGVVVAGLTFGLASMITLGAWSLGAFGMENADSVAAEPALSSGTAAATDPATGTGSTTADTVTDPSAANTTNATTPTMDTSVGSLVTTTTAPTTTLPPIAPAPRPINQPSGGGGGGGGGSTGGGGSSGGGADDGSCYTASITSINNVRANAGQGPLTRMSNARACAWARTLAERGGTTPTKGTLSHNAPDCGSSGGQVVGYVKSTGPGNESSAAGTIINGWFASSSHYEVLTWPTLNRIGMAFYQVTAPNGAWAVYGVANLCP